MPTPRTGKTQALKAKTRAKFDESVEQPPALSHFLESLQSLKQGVAQIRNDEAAHRRALEAAVANCKQAEAAVAERERALEVALADRMRAEDAALANLPKLDEISDIYVRLVLDLCNGNRVRAAKILGVGKTTLYRNLPTGNSSQNEDRSALAPSDGAEMRVPDWHSV